MKRTIGMDGGDVGVTVWMSLVPSDSTPKNGYNGKFYSMYILLQF